MCEYLLAIILLAAPPEHPIDTNAFSLRHTLRALAIEWEILDPREVDCVFARSEWLVRDINVLRQRHIELKSSPLDRDSNRFPDRITITNFLAFNREFHEHVRMRALGEPHRQDLSNALQEANELYRLWDTLRDARCEYFYITARRQALSRLRDMLGAEAYYSGKLPPYVPLWRFQEMR